MPGIRQGGVDPFAGSISCGDFDNAAPCLVAWHVRRGGARRVAPVGCLSVLPLVRWYCWGSAAIPKGMPIKSRAHELPVSAARHHVMDMLPHEGSIASTFSDSVQSHVVGVQHWASRPRRDANRSHRSGSAVGIVGAPSYNDRQCSATGSSVTH